MRLIVESVKKCALLKWAFQKYALQAIKKKYAQRLKELFIAKMNYTSVNNQIGIFFDHFLKPKLIRKKLNEMAAFGELLTYQRGISLFLKTLNAYEKQPSLAARTVGTMVDLSIKAMRTNPAGTHRALESFDRVEKLMVERFTHHDGIAYLESILQVVCDYPTEFFNQTALVQIENLLNEAERIQAERPKIYTVHEQPFVLEHFLALRMHFEKKTFIVHVFQEILNMTVIWDTQIVQKGLRACTQKSNSTIPFLHKKNNYTFTISTELHPECSLKQSSENFLFKGGIECFLTNEKNMETRTFIMHLPFNNLSFGLSSADLGEFASQKLGFSDDANGQGPFASLKSTRDASELPKSEGEKPKTQVLTLLHHTEAWKFVELLEATVANLADFDDTYLNLKLDASQKALSKQIISSWAISVQQDLGKALFDFNSTPFRPTMSYAIESPIMKTALQDPYNLEKVLRAARQKNIFNLKEHLSLLPEKLAKIHPKIAFFSQDEILSVIELFLGKSKKECNIYVTENEKVSLSLHKEIVKSNGLQIIKLSTTLHKEGHYHNRITYYPIKKQELAHDRMQAIIKSGLLVRDLLLAKAESFHYCLKNLFDSSPLTTG